MRVRITRGVSVGVSVAAVAFVLLLGISPQVMAFTNGEVATTVIGQSNYTSGTANDGVGTGSAVANGVFEARGMAFDSHGDLWVADTNNNRVLEFVPGADGCGTGVLCSGMTASVVIGQMSMTANGYNEGNGGATDNQSSLYWPYSVAFDSHGDLWVADAMNNRILEFAPGEGGVFTAAQDGEEASVVLGQSSFIARTADGGVTPGDLNQAGLSGPAALTFDSQGNLWVADEYNNRVVDFVPGSSGCGAGTLCTGMNASLVLGQTNFYGFHEDNPEESATTMYEPNGIAIAPDGYIWVLDGDNGRVLGFIPGTSPCSLDVFCSGMPASVVIGVQTFNGPSGGSCSSRVLNDTGICAAEGVAIDSSGDLWIADSFDDRVLEFVPGSSGCAADQLCTYMAASVVLGQSSFTASSANEGSSINAAGLHDPYALAADSSRNLWVSDYDNNRILEFLLSPSSTSTSTTTTTTTTSSSTSTSSTTRSGTTTSSTTSTSTTTSTISSEVIRPSSGSNACESNTQYNVQLNAQCFTSFAAFNVISAAGAPVGGATVVISATGFASQTATTASTASTSALCTLNPSWTAQWGAYWGCDVGSTGPFTLNAATTYSYTVTLPSGTVITGSIGPDTTPATSPWTVTLVTIMLPSVTT